MSERVFTLYVLTSKRNGDGIANRFERPQGVGMGRKPPLWLKDGDIVEVGLEGVGSCVNSVRFVKEDGDAESKPKI